MSASRNETSCSITDFFGDDCLIPLNHDGADLSPDHGYPVRLVFVRGGLKAAEPDAGAATAAASRV